MDDFANQSLSIFSRKCRLHSLFCDADGFISWITSQRRSREELTEFVRLYYPHVIRTRLYQASLISVCTDEDCRAAISSILSDEYGCGHDAHRHLAMYERLLHALGIDVSMREETIRNEIIASRLYGCAMWGILAKSSWAIAYGAVGIGAEVPIPIIYEKILAAFQRTFGAELDSCALEVFRVHIKLDGQHALSLFEAINHICEFDSNTYNDLQLGFQMNLEARHRMLSGIVGSIHGEK